MIIGKSAADFKKIAQDAELAERLLKLGITPHLMSDVLSLSAVTLKTLASNLGSAAASGVKGSPITEPLSFIQTSASRQIAMTTLVSMMARFNEESPEDGFALLFLKTWGTFLDSMRFSNLGAEARWDLNVRQVWMMLHYVYKGQLKTKKCSECGAVHIELLSASQLCVICEQMRYTHCQAPGCDVKIDRRVALDRKKWKEGAFRAYCIKCRRDADYKASRDAGVFTRFVESRE